MAERTHWLGSGGTEQDSRVGLAALFAGSGLAVTPGVLNGLAVTQTGAASAGVSVAIGRALNQAASSIGGGYLEALDAAKVVDVLGVNPAESSPRRDLIVYESGLPVGQKVHVVKGVAAAVPVDPPVPAQAVALARVRVKVAGVGGYNGTEVIVNADIDDLRTFTGPARPVGMPFAEAADVRNVTLAAGSGSAVVTLPVGRFTVAPIVGALVASGAGDASTLIVRAHSISAAGFTLLVNSAAGTPVGGTFAVHWTAKQMTPTSAGG